MTLTNSETLAARAIMRDGTQASIMWAILLHGVETTQSILTLIYGRTMARLLLEGLNEPMQF